MAGNGISIVDLLGFEPYSYLGERIIRELFDEQNPSYSEQVSDDFLYGIADKNYHMFDHIKKMLNLSAASVVVVCIRDFWMSRDVHRKFHWSLVY